MEKVFYDNCISGIKRCLEIYERNRIADKVYNFVLDENQKSFNYEISESNVAHLLGVNILFLKENGLVNEENSFDILHELIRNSNNIYQKLNELPSNVKIDNIFSPFITSKIMIFASNIECNISKIMAIIEFDKEKTYASFLSDGLGDIMDIDYFIIKKLNYGGFAILALSKDNNGILRPISSLKSMDLSNIEKYLYKQNCYLPHFVCIKDILDSSVKNLWLNDTLKLQKMSFLQELALRYKISIIVTNDYKHQLERVKSTTQTYQNIRSLIKAIKHQEEISFATDSLDKNGKELFEELSKALETSSLSKSDKDLENELIKEKERKVALQTENERLLRRIQLLESQNELARAKLETIQDVLNDSGLNLTNPKNSL